MPAVETPGAHHSETTPEGIFIEWDVPIEMDDGLVLRADVYRPEGDGPHPVIVSHGPYGKGLSFKEGYPSAWDIMAANHPDVTAGSSNRFQNWEVADPEKWVREGYALVRVDSRGAGRSPGHMDVWSARETRDFAACIEWSGTQAWSNGKVGLSGISYYAINQWQVAALQPAHLAAICVWEGASDFYRDMARHGGVYSSFIDNWLPKQVKTVQYGLGENGPVDKNSGLLVCGDETLSPDELAANLTDVGKQFLAYPLATADVYASRNPDFSRIITPLLSAANWGGQGLHLRGNVEGYLRVASEQKWLEVHGLEHWSHYYTEYGRELQLLFFDHFLKGMNNGWDARPPVQLNVRSVDATFKVRAESCWPLERTSWTRYYLHSGSRTLSNGFPSRVNSLTYETTGDGLLYELDVEQKTEITGPISAKLFVETTAQDLDLFLVVRVFDPKGEEVVFHGALDPHTPVAQGWLRASQRALDPELSEPYRPVHTHEHVEPVEPGTVYELDVEVWPTCIVVPAGHTIRLSVRGKDYVYPGEPAHLSNMPNPMTGVGPFVHAEPLDRDPTVFDGTVTVHTGGERASYLLLPMIPSAA